MYLKYVNPYAFSREFSDGKKLWCALLNVQDMLHVMWKFVIKLNFRAYCALEKNPYFIALNSTYVLFQFFILLEFSGKYLTYGEMVI